MSKYERGVYEPSDEVRVFDGAEDEDDAEGSRLPLLIVLALLVLAMFGGLVWLAYTQGVARGRTETPVLAAAPGPERVAPANAGGSNVPYQGFKIYEQPAPADYDSQAAAPQKPAAPAAPAPAPAPEKLAQAAQPAPVPVVAPAPKPAPKPEPVAAPPPRPAITASAPPPAPKPLPKPVTVAKAPPPAPVKAAPVSAPVSTVATGGPRTLPGVAAATPAPKPVAAPAPVKAITGAFVLQIGAYKSQDDADAAWKTYKAKHAALLSGYGPDVQKADLGDKGTWYRLRIAGFSDRDVASALCDRLKADGGGCFLGK